MDSVWLTCETVKNKLFCSTAEQHHYFTTCNRQTGALALHFSRTKVNANNIACEIVKLSQVKKLHSASFSRFQRILEIRHSRTTKPSSVLPASIPASQSRIHPCWSFSTGRFPSWCVFQGDRIRFHKSYEDSHMSENHSGMSEWGTRTFCVSD